VLLNLTMNLRRRQAVLALTPILLIFFFWKCKISCHVYAHIFPAVVQGYPCSFSWIMPIGFDIV
jgi:hypothetical protein